MKTVTINKHTINIYDSIEDLSIVRFHKYNKFLLIDSGVGSDLQDATNHINRAIKYIDTDSKLAKIELSNLLQNIHLINEELSPKYLAYSALVYEIDGKIVTDLSDDGLKQVHDKLNDVPISFLNAFIEGVKKKMDQELTLYFPALFEDSGSKEYFARLKERTLLLLNSIIEGNDNGKRIEQIDNFLFSLAKPKIFSGPESAEIQFDKQFEEMSLVLQQHIGSDTSKMTVIQYYSAFDLYKKQMKAK